MTLDMVVCIKQVPDTNDVKIDPRTGTLVREGVPSIVNPDDRHAVEAALQLREKYGGVVKVITMGPPQARDALMEVGAMGADELYLVSDRAFAGADTWATSYTLGKAIQYLGKFDIVLCGRQAIDGDTAQIGPQLAEYLEIPQVTYACKIKDMENGRIVVERAREDGYESVESPLPVLVTCIKDLNKPRYPSVGGIIRAVRETDIKLLTAAELEPEENKIGLAGSPTEVSRTFAPEQKGRGVLLKGETKDVVQQLLVRLRAVNIVD